MQLRYGSPEEAGMSAERLAHIARLAEGWVKDGTHPALVVLVARRGVIVLHEAFGQLRQEPDSPPVVRDTIFPLASMTKPMTATAVMCLVEDGLLGLNRPVQDYIPEFVGKGKQQVMVHHLLTHTSGLDDLDVNTYVSQKLGSTLASIQERAFLLSDTEYLGPRCEAPLSKLPGAEMSYCNMNYRLLGELVLRVSGTPLARFAEDRIFRPLDMADTHYLTPEALWPRVVQRPPGAVPQSPGTPELLRASNGAAAVHATARDVAVFCQMFLNQGQYGEARVLSPASAREMTRNQIPGIGSRFLDEYYPEAYWGYGWNTGGNSRGVYFPGALLSRKAFCHSGGLQMFMWGDPVYDVVGVYLCVAVTMQRQRPKWYADLFAAAVTAALVDE